jgi:hypothetical protein
MAITEAEVAQAQQTWADGIVAIGKAFTDGGDYKALATDHLKSLYGYSLGKVLFKPTKTSEQQFRMTEPDAMSYFVGGHIAEDKGFAIQPWTAVRFENEGTVINGDTAIAMGNYFFTDGNSGDVVKVEYTFGYVKVDGKLIINLHHSSVPFQP